MKDDIRPDIQDVAVSMLLLNEHLPRTDHEDSIPPPSLDFVNSQESLEEYVPPEWLKDVNVSAVCVPYPFALSEVVVDREAQIPRLLRWASNFSFGSHDGVMFQPYTDRRSTYGSIECVFSTKVTEAVVAIQRGLSGYENMDPDEAFELNKDQKAQLIMGALAHDGVEQGHRRIGGWVERRRARFEFEAARSHATRVLYDVYKNDYERGGDGNREFLSLKPDVTSASLVRLLAQGGYDKEYAEFLELPQTSTQDVSYDIASTRIFVQLLRHETTQEGIDIIDSYIASYKEKSKLIAIMEEYERWCEKNARYAYFANHDLPKRAENFRRRIPQLEKEREEILNEVLSTGYGIYQRSES